MTIRRVHFPQRRRDDLDLRIFLDDAIDHADEDARIELRLRRDFGARNAEALLQVLFVADEHVHEVDDAAEHLDGARLALPEALHSFSR